MSKLQSIICSIIFLFAAACQQTTPINENPAPSGVDLPTLVPPSPISAANNALPTIIASATITATLTNTPTFTPSPTRTLPPVPTTTPTRPGPDLPAEFTFGTSTQGQSLTAYRVGEGGQVLMLVGGIHGGFEANTVSLVQDLYDHFQNTPADVLPGIALVFVPVLNPDGLQVGDTLAGRFNGAGVDLNRNWDCGWEPTAYFRQQEVDAGSRPFSEPETLAMSALIRSLMPEVVLFYHSAVGGIFEGDCGTVTSRAAQMAAVLGEATGYPYGESFSAYTVTGTAPGWVDSLGIAAADVELFSPTATEFERNLRGVMALQCWLLGPQADGLSMCSE